MKNKKLKLTTLGFTLVELLAVIIVIGIIALLIVPNISRIIENARSNTMQRSLEHIVEAADNYYNLNIFELPEYGSPIETKNINVLLNEGYIDKLPSNTEGIFFLMYTSQDDFHAEVILSKDNKYYSSIEDLNNKCDLYVDLCDTEYKDYYQQECTCP